MQNRIVFSHLAHLFSALDMQNNALFWVIYTPKSLTALKDFKLGLTLVKSGMGMVCRQEAGSSPTCARTGGLYSTLDSPYYRFANQWRCSHLERQTLLSRNPRR